MADQKISALTVNPSIDGTEELPLAKGGNNFKILLSAIKAWILGDQIIKKVKFTVLPAAILTANSVPVELIPAPGAGFGIRVISVVARLRFNTVAYTSTYFRIIGQSATNIITQYQHSTGQNFLNATASRSNTLYPNNNAFVGENFFENDAMMLQADQDSFSGDSEIDGYVLYEIVVL